MSTRIIGVVGILAALALLPALILTSNGKAAKPFNRDCVSSERGKELVRLCVVHYETGPRPADAVVRCARRVSALCDQNYLP